MQRTLIASLDKSNLDKEVSVSGWVENIRDHGGVIFIDLREGLDIFHDPRTCYNSMVFLDLFYFLIHLDLRLAH